MAIQQGFPNLDQPIVDPETGGLTLVWFRFLISLFNRTGGAAGNNSASFNYPDSTGAIGQVLTSQGVAKPSIWTTLATKLSQFVNDVGFITADALVGLSTPDTVNAQIETAAAANTSNTIPPPDTTTGFAGVSGKFARADHSHPRETNPVFAGAVSANLFVNKGVLWSVGAGAPTGAPAKASLYSRTDGANGTLLYVFDGAVWHPIG